MCGIVFEFSQTFQIFELIFICSYQNCSFHVYRKIHISIVLENHEVVLFFMKLCVLLTLKLQGGESGGV